MTGILANRVALITGGGSGIGKAVCELFAREGAQIAAVDLNEGQLHETLKSLQSEGVKTGHHAFQADVSSAKDVNNQIQRIHSKYGEPATIVVNCAGIIRDGILLKMTEGQFDKVIDVNLKGTFLINQSFVKAITEHKMPGGTIVNISSIAAKIGNYGASNYCASKAGVIGFTKAVAKEIAMHGIRVNAVLPGLIATPMIQDIPAEGMEAITRQIPLRRDGLPSEVAEACLFFASERSSYITGTTLEVTGGMFL